MSKEAMKLALEALEVLGWQPTEEAMDYRDNAITALREALAEQPAQTATYTCGVCGVSMQMEQPAQQDEIDWKDQYEKQKRRAEMWVAKYEADIGPLEKAVPVTAQQEPVVWKLVPVEPTKEMLKAMDECSTEGYDERLYAGHAASVYMAAVDAAPTPPAQPQQEPVVWMYVNKSTHETKFQKHMRDFVDHSLWSEVPLYGEPLAKHEFQCVCGAVWCGDEMVHLPDKRPQPSKPWVGLTQQDIDIAFDDTQEGGGFNEFARAIEAKLRSKNEDRN